MPDDTAPPPVKPVEPETFSKDYVRELREENKGWRLKATEMEQHAAQARADAEKAAQEALAKIADATTAASARVIRAEIKAAAIKAGMIDLDGLKMLDLSAIKLNADGEVEGAETLLENAKKAKPYLFGDAKTSSTAKPPEPKPPAKKNALEMTDAEYVAAKAEMLTGRR